MIPPSSEPAACSTTRRTSTTSGTNTTCSNTTCRGRSRLLHMFLAGVCSLRLCSGHWFSKPEPGFRMVVRFNSSNTLGLDEPYPVNVEIHAMDQSCFHPLGVEGIRPSCLLTIEDPNGHFIEKTIILESIPAYQSISIKVSLVPGNLVSSIGELPLGQTFTLKSHEGTILGRETISIPFNVFRRTLEYASECNILSIGYPGVGKTTFTMTALSALSSQIIPLPGLGGLDTHVTRRVTRYSISDWIPDSKINIVDTCGIADKSFTLELLDDLVKGNVPDGYNMHDYAGHATYKTANAATMPVPTAVLFFIKAAQSNNDALMKGLKTYIERITLLNHSPLVIVSFMSELTERDAAQSLHDISMYLKIPTTRIFPFNGYVNESTKMPAVDQNVMKILEMAARTSDSYVKATAPQRARDAKEQKEQLAREESAKKERCARQKLEKDKFAKEQEKLAREDLESKERLAKEKERKEKLAREESKRQDRLASEELERKERLVLAEAEGKEILARQEELRETLADEELKRNERLAQEESERQERLAREDSERKERLAKIRESQGILAREESERQERLAREDLERKDRLAKDMEREEKLAREESQRKDRLAREESERKDRLAREDVERSARLAEDQEMLAQKELDMQEQFAREHAEQRKLQAKEKAEWIWQLVKGASCCLVTILAIALSCPCRKAAPMPQEPAADIPLGECASPPQRPPSEASSELTRAVTTDTEEPAADIPLGECTSPPQSPRSGASSELTRAVTTDTEADSEQWSPSEAAAGTNNKGRAGSPAVATQQQPKQDQEGAGPGGLCLTPAGPGQAEQLKAQCSDASTACQKGAFDTGDCVI